MKPFKRARLIFPLVLPLMLLLTASVAAQNKVVVIPLMEEATGPPAPVPKTGQTTCSNEAGTTITCAGTGQDGDIQAGVAWPNPRFVDHGNGTVTDRLTELIWLKEGNCNQFYSGDSTGQNNRKWEFALNACNQLASGFCGLNDSSAVGDWRLPNRKEFESLIDLGQYGPALPAGCPLASSTVVLNYWSATTIAGYSDYAWYVYFYTGYVGYDYKSSTYHVRCVR